MGKWLHPGLIVALLVSFVQAPFGHFHDEDLDHAHGRGAQHAHWAYATEEARWDHAEHDACLLDWLAADPPAAPQVLVDLTSVPFHTVLRAIAFVPPAPAPRNHDPPRLAGPPARSPPHPSHLA